MKKIFILPILFGGIIFANNAMADAQDAQSEINLAVLTSKFLQTSAPNSMDKDKFINLLGKNSDSVMPSDMMNACRESISGSMACEQCYEFTKKIIEEHNKSLKQVGTAEKIPSMDNDNSFPPKIEKPQNGSKSALDEAWEKATSANSSTATASPESNLNNKTQPQGISETELENLFKLMASNKASQRRLSSFPRKTVCDTNKNACAFVFAALSKQEDRGGIMCCKASQINKLGDGNYNMIGEVCFEKLWTNVKSEDDYGAFIDRHGSISECEELFKNF